jgi:hypothetical protein
MKKPLLMSERLASLLHEEKANELRFWRQGLG